ncbi:hypothetical protein ABZV64_04100 [Streptomyces sp. NPDC004959]|uniref:hypothetical protein n=1 Tax=unclassified Streptomyces TaxID=2593676 RepID=UPI0033AE5195
MIDSRGCNETTLKAWLTRDALRPFEVRVAMDFYGSAVMQTGSTYSVVLLPRTPVHAAACTDAAYGVKSFLDAFLDERAAFLPTAPRVPGNAPCLTPEARKPSSGRRTCS